MDRCNFWPYNSQEPVVQTWESRCQSPYESTLGLPTDKISKIWEITPRQNTLKCLPSVSMPYQTPAYQSLHDYTFDPVIAKSISFQSLISSQSDEEYSSGRKAFYPVVPYNTQTFNYLPVMGRLDITRLGQTKVLDFVYSSQHVNNQFGVVSLSNIISPLLNRMGTMENLETGESVGTCTLIAENLIIVARHAVQGIYIQNIKVTFGYTEFRGSSYYAGKTSLDYVIEEDIACDYAIIKLKEPVGRRLGYVSLSTDGNTLSEPALLHYPLGKTLRVSVHTFIQTQYQTKYLLPYHDSDYFSSGGAYFDPSGCMIAMHLGSELKGDTMNVLRYARPLNDIVRRNPHSILQKFANGELSQASSYRSDAYWTYLSFTSHNYLIDEEGYQSEKVLRSLLSKHLKKDKKIKFTASGAISFLEDNLQYIADTYPNKYRSFRRECLGKVGVHSLTKQYSVKGVIESDHTIPHEVWKSTTNPKMKRLVTGGGTRPGENDMPAITIPYDRHRKLRTTGSSTEAKNFRQYLVTLCNQDKIDDALVLCFKEYALHKIKLQDYRTQIESSLGEHIKLKLITNQQKGEIIKKLF